MGLAYPAGPTNIDARKILDRAGVQPHWLSLAGNRTRAFKDGRAAIRRRDRWNDATSGQRATDSELFSAFLAGDDLAFMELFDRHTHRLYLYALAAAGQAGVERVLALMEAEIVRDMKLMGKTAIAQLTQDNLRRR